MKYRLPTCAVIFTLFIFLALSQNDLNVSGLKDDEESASAVGDISSLVGDGDALRLVISPIPEVGARVLFMATDETLNLTCTVILVRQSTLEAMDSIDSKNDTKEMVQFDLGWHLPISLEESENRVVHTRSPNSLQLLVKKLRETDSGEYKCTGKESIHNSDAADYSGSLVVQVKPRIADSVRELSGCKEFMFMESSVWSLNINCSNRWRRSPCCDKLIPLAKLNMNPNQLPSMKVGAPMDDMVYLQTTVYTAIGCGMIFLIVSTGVVIIIYRLHMKRSSTYQRARQNLQDPASRGQDSSEPGGFLVAFNFRDGLHVLPRPHPPSYGEIVRSSIVIGPPPPYSSVDNLCLESSHVVNQSQTIINIPTDCEGDECRNENTQRLLTLDSSTEPLPARLDQEL